MKLYFILALALFSLVLVSASDDSFGVGTAVYNSIERANATYNLTVFNSTYFKEQFANLNNSIVQVKDSVNSANQNTLATQTRIDGLQTQLTSLGTQLTAINDKPTTSAYTFIFLIIIIVLLLVAIILIWKKKSKGIYRCAHCRKLYLARSDNLEVGEEDEEEEE